MCSSFQDFSFAKDIDSTCLLDRGETMNASGDFVKHYGDLMGPTDEQ